MNIETKWLKDFVVLAQTRNFSKAAAIRHVSQPAFSRRIKALESKLNCKVVNRLHQPLQLTLSGEIFLKRAENLLIELDLLSAELQQQNLRTPLVFSATHTLSIGVFPSIVEHLNKLEFTVDTQLKIADADDCANLLKHKHCDYLLAFSDPLLDAFHHDSILLSKVKLLPVCLANEQGEPIYQLSQPKGDVPYLAYQENIYLDRVVSKLLKAKGQQVNFNKRLMSPMADSLKMMALKGLGVAWIPEFSLATELASQQLVVAGDKQWQPELSLRLYRAKKTHNNHSFQEKVWLHFNNLNL
ncbi:LysR family transcriptional regulator [Colwellia piezophila]|uniref:LysR family transcriptional regulator n=1 Tax=Colwellia piezophila TaxID=211668 RepID=UPI00036B555F|nr:LysR family transcriptional regulator [Colwellia piezophila]